MKIKGLRWFIIGLIAIATVINYIDRNAMAVMWPEISKELGLSKDDYALLLTCFTLSYAFGQSLFGKILDAVGTRIGFTIAILIWSLSIAGHALARTLLMFGILRATLGMSEAGAWPGAAKANALWFPATERALAQGIFNAGASVGAIVAAPLIAFLFLLIGWKMVFLMIGVLGFIWIIPWLFVYRADPETHPWLTEDERDYILLHRVSKDAQVSTTEYAPNIKGLLSHKESWSIILCRFFLDPIWWLFVSWLPIYLAETFGFDIKQIGLFGWVPFVGAAIGSLLGGALSGLLIRRGVSVGKARKSVIIIGALIMIPALVLCMNAATPLLAVLLIAVVLFGFQMAIGNIQTLPGDYFSGKSVGSLSGLGGTAANLGVLLTTWVVPMATKVSFAPVFLMAGLLVPVSLLALLLLGGRVRRLEGPKS
ncbi:MFS transporter [Asticcacaulis sp. YBE204]|uniref:MFS transporter n=1 Tax=Asticcacaulis sp. YBE204 TaxID=1282363 RepID=UPI0003C3C4AB|nr:MFS transporter [Asticcacaulis sp. YBE204]ESQ78352.1 hypothetical protein AEYBE204_14365 [Asticcacaulis sp. YBE204]